MYFKDILINKYSINAILRVVALGSKFILVVLFSSVFDERFFASYILIMAGHMLLTVVIPMESQVVFFREIKNKYSSQGNRSNITPFAWAGFLICLLMYPIVYVCLYYLNLFEGINLWLLTSVYLVESLLVQLNWYLLFLNKQLQASVILILKSSLWMVLCVLFSFSNDSEITTNGMLIIWGAVNLAIAIYGFVSLIGIPIVGPIFKILSRLLSSPRVIGSTLFLVMGVLSWKIYFSIDRFIVEILFSASELSAYGLFITIAFSMTSLFDAIYTSFVYPTIYKNAETKASTSVMLRLLSIGGLIIILLAVSTLTLSALILPYFIPEQIWTYKAILPYVVFSGALLSFLSILHHIFNSHGLYVSQLLANLVAMSMFSILMFYILDVDNLLKFSQLYSLLLFALAVFKSSLFISKLKLSWRITS